MTISESRYDAYLEGLAIAEKEERLGKELWKAEDALEEVRNQIIQILEQAERYEQDGQIRIRGYALEERFEDLCYEEKQLEIKVDQLNNELGEL